MNIFNTLMQMIALIFKTISKGIDARKEYKLRESGKNEEKLKNLGIVNKRTRTARDIIKRVRNKDGDNQ